MEFLVSSGFVIFTCNTVIVAFLHARAQAAVQGIQMSHAALLEQRAQVEDRSMRGDDGHDIDKERRSGITAAALGQSNQRKTGCGRFCTALWCVALPALLMQLACLGIGFWQNILSAQARDEASRFPYDGVWVNGSWTNGTRTIAYGLELRQRHDMLHGSCKL